MLRQIQKLPRPIFFLNHYTYPIAATIAVLVALVLFNPNGLNLAGLVAVAAIAALLVLFWIRFHVQGDANLPPTSDDMLAEIEHNSAYSLIAFESEYCPTCIATDPRVVKLSESAPNGLKVYRVTIQREPGRALFKKYDLRMTPSYALIDSKGRLVMDWLLVLPIERVMYAIRHPQSA